MSDASNLRASDEDRERCAQSLREHFAAGRIGEDELADRLDAVYEARTTAELQAVGRDLTVLARVPADLPRAVPVPQRLAPVRPGTRPRPCAARARPRPARKQPPRRPDRPPSPPH